MIEEFLCRNLSSTRTCLGATPRPHVTVGALGGSAPGDVGVRIFRTRSAAWRLAVRLVLTAGDIRRSRLDAAGGRSGQLAAAASHDALIFIDESFVFRSL